MERLDGKGVLLSPLPRRIIKNMAVRNFSTEIPPLRSQEVQRILRSLLDRLGFEEVRAY